MNSPRKQLDQFFVASKRGWTDAIEELASSQGFDINHIGHDGKTALYHAIHEQHLPVVKALLSHKIDVNLKSFCTYHRDHSGVQLISCDEPPIVTAARVGNVHIVELLLRAGANVDLQAYCHTHLSGLAVKDRTALHFACDEMNVEIVQLLLNHNADVNVEDKQGELPMHRAVRCRHCKQQSEILKLLCEHGSDVNLVNRISCSPLYLASFYGCVDKVEILLLYGANPNEVCSRTNSYGSALHIASLKDRQKLAEKLILHGTNLNLRNTQDSTPLYLNICGNNRSSVAALLIFHGADMNGADRFGYTLMAICIRNMRLDCESLARLMVFAGYDLRQDTWLEPSWANGKNQNEVRGDAKVPDVPIAAGRVKILCDWLRGMQQNALCLSDLCRIVLRKTLALHNGGKSIVENIETLPLPSRIRDFVALKSFYPTRWTLLRNNSHLTLAFEA